MIYMDYAATTPLAPEALDAMMPFFTDNFANPSGNYGIADTARKATREAGRKLAALLNCAPSELYFTGSGTESDNLAITGTAFATDNGKKHIITSAVEHPAVLNTVKNLEKRGFRVTILPVDRYGFISAESLRKALSSDTLLVSVMTANNEIGTIEPIKELCGLAHSYGALFHTDAVQAVGNIPVDVKDTGVDLLSCSAHKLNGPKGVGLLYVKEGLQLSPVIFGGGQERGLRSGTENVAGIVGFGKAAELAGKRLEKGVQGEVAKLRDYMAGRLLNEIDGARLNGSETDRLPSNLNISIPGAESETMLIMLNAEGICASGGSACSSRSGKPSHVLAALGLDGESIRGALRLTISYETTKEEADTAIEALKKVAEKARSFRI